MNKRIIKKHCVVNVIKKTFLNMVQASKDFCKSLRNLNSKNKYKIKNKTIKRKGKKCLK